MAIIELVATGKLPDHGFLKQEDIPLTDFLQTATGRLYGNHSAVENGH